MNAITHGQNFGLAQTSLCGMDLPVNIGLGNMVKIDQCQMANTTARQGLCSPRPDTAHTDNRHMRLPDVLGTGQSKQPLKTTKATIFRHLNVSDIQDLLQ